MLLTNKELGKYLEKVRKSMGDDMSTHEVHRLTGVSQSYLSLIENGKRKASAIVLKKLAKVYNLDYLDLYEKAGYVDLIESEKINIEEIIKHKLPVLGTVKAGYDYLAEENIIDYIDPGISISDPSNFFVLRVKGDSMSPFIDEDDDLVIHKCEDFENKDICVVRINGEEATVKKVTKTEDGIELHAYNPYYPVKKFTFEEMQNIPVSIIGVVVRQIRKLK